MRFHKKDPFKLYIVALPGAKLFQRVLEFVDAVRKGMVGSKEKREANHLPIKVRGSGKESYQNFYQIDKIAMSLVNSNCVVNSAHYEDLSDFQSRARCAKIKRTKDVDWEGLAMGQYSIFFSL